MTNQGSATGQGIDDRTDQDSDRWTSLYRIAGVAALISALFIPLQIAVFVTNPFPTDAAGWFELFQRNKVIGLIDLDILLVADQLLLIPILLALYVTLRRYGRSLMALGITTAVLAVPLFIASNPSFEMLSLSDRYGAAATDTERAALLAAGQMLLATWQGTAFQTGYLLASIGGLLIAVVMLRTHVFRKSIGYLGLVGNAIGLGLFIPVVGTYLAVVSVLPLEVWYVLLGARLLQFSRAAVVRDQEAGGNEDVTTASTVLARRAAG
jgi:Domain of unknown function (DUF4386)